MLIVMLRTDSEFEIIPNPLSVIALDDITTHDITINEPWEHIDFNDATESKAQRTPVSYAKVLAGSK